MKYLYTFDSINLLETNAQLDSCRLAVEAFDDCIFVLGLDVTPAVLVRRVSTTRPNKLCMWATGLGVG